MSDTRDDFVAFFKAHPGYDAPSLTIRGSNVGELADRIGAAEAAGLFAIVGNADSGFKAAYNLGAGLGATPLEHPGANQPPPRAAAPTVNPPGLSAPTCPHGTKTYKTGQKNGNTWKAWMCPAVKGTPGQCPPEWLKD